MAVDSHTVPTVAVRGDLVENKYYGKYRAIVKDINDPERRGRIRVECPSVLGTYLSAWCEPCIPYATDFAGDFYVPPINEGIWVEFEEGDPNKPIWNGGWYRPNSSPLPMHEPADKYRFIVFKDTVVRFGDKEVIIELRDGDKSYTVSINSDTWKGLNYIGSKNDDELNNIENLIINKQFILEDFPNEVKDNFRLVEESINGVGGNFETFINASYNPFVSGVSEQFSGIQEMFNAQDSLNNEFVRRIEALENK